jgi:hypothetical protein
MDFVWESEQARSLSTTVVRPRNRGSISGKNNRFVSFSFQTGYWTNQASRPMDKGCAFSRVKRPKREADHLLPSNAKVKNEWIAPLPIRYHATNLPLQWLLVRL